MDNPSNKQKGKSGQRGDVHGIGNYDEGYNDSGYDEEQYMGAKSNKGGKPSAAPNKNVHRKDDKHNNTNHMEEGRFKKQSGKADHR